MTDQTNTTPTSVLLFGGTFDPIHNGHLIIARMVAEALQIDKVILIPSAIPPHKLDKKITPAAIRYEMTKAAVAGDILFDVSDCELNSTGPSYTIETITHFRNELGDKTKLHWLVGGDTLNDMGCWYKLPELVDSCTIVTANRPGHIIDDLSGLKDKLSPEQLTRLKSNIVETPQIDISSTTIRNRTQTGLSIRYLTPEPVQKFIQDHHLYG